MLTGAKKGILHNLHGRSPVVTCGRPAKASVGRCFIKLHILPD